MKRETKIAISKILPPTAMLILLIASYCWGKGDVVIFMIPLILICIWVELMIISNKIKKD